MKLNQDTCITPLEVLLHPFGMGVTREISQESVRIASTSLLILRRMYHSSLLFNSKARETYEDRSAGGLQPSNWEHEEISPALVIFLASSVLPSRKNGILTERRCLPHGSPTHSNKVFCSTQVFQRKLGSLVKAGVYPVGYKSLVDVGLVGLDATSPA